MLEGETTMRGEVDDLNDGLNEVIKSTCGLDKKPWVPLTKDTGWYDDPDCGMKLPADRITLVVGDLESDEKGSGARMNADKLAVEQIPVRCWRSLFAAQVYKMPDPNAVYLSLLLDITDKLADFQEGKITGKQLLRYVPMSWVHDAIDVFNYGEYKYKKYNWLKGQPWSVPLASAVRHAKAVFGGEIVDQESGLAHTGHFTCNLIMLATFFYTYPEGNDFPDPKFFRPEG